MIVLAGHRAAWVRSATCCAKAHTRAPPPRHTTCTPRLQAVEDLYFTKEDQRLMSKLLSKIKVQSDMSDKHAAEGVLAAEKSALKQVIGKYNISADDVEKLLKWKHTHY